MTSTPTEANTSGPTTATPSDEIDLGQPFGVLVDRWVLIVGTTALFGLGGIFWRVIGGTGFPVRRTGP